jgi:thiosulfate dehydrogenase
MLATVLLVLLSAPAEAADAGVTQHGVYVDAEARDDFIAKKALERVVADGKALFGDAKGFKGTSGLACASCHPDGAATHAETFPKYVDHLQRVALLRDAVVWCVLNSVHGPPLQDSDPRLKAVEAYLLTQRAGLELAPGKK